MSGPGSRSQYVLVDRKVGEAVEVDHKVGTGKAVGGDWKVGGASFQN